MSDATLPDGWAMATVGDLADYVNGRAFKPTEWKESGEPIIRIQNLNDDRAKYNFSTEQHEDKYRVKNGDLLFAWSASLGAHIWNGGDAWLNQHIFNVHPKSCATKAFVFYLLTKITAELYAKAHGSGMVHVTKGKFETTEIALPPINEQHRIVAKIEELFSELDQGVASLKTAREQLKVYRQALLKHAFEGKLTAAWREKHRDKLEPTATLLARIQTEREARHRQQLKDWEANGKQGSKPKAPKPLLPITAEEVAELPELPEGWGWGSFDSLFEALSDGGLKIKQSDYLAEGILPVIDQGENFIGGYLSDVDMKWVGNLPVLLFGDHTRRFKLINFPFALGADGVKVIGLSNVCNPTYCYYIALTRRFEDRGYSRHFQFLKKAVFPVCSRLEQDQIVSEIESRFSSIDQLEQSLSTSLQQAEALRQSILKRAFSGRLVPQDPNDEPATELLARIKAEREEHPNLRKSRGAK